MRTEDYPNDIFERHRAPAFAHWQKLLRERVPKSDPQWRFGLQEHDLERAHKAGFTHIYGLLLVRAF